MLLLERPSIMALKAPDLAVDPTPLYYRLESILRGAIESREYRVGQNLPSERELGEQYGVSRITVRRALETLEREGLVRRGRGRSGGTFVLDRPALLRKRVRIGSLDRVAGRQVSNIKIFTFDVRPCDHETGSLLGLAPDEDVRYVERLISTADGPVAYVRNFVPLHIGAKIKRKELSATFLRDVLTKHHGVAFAEVQDDVEAYLAESRVATLLKIRSGSPLLRITRLFIGPDGRPVALTILLISSKYRMAVTFPGEVIA
jgi:GntR family transcriptional regulator